MLKICADQAKSEAEKEHIASPKLKAGKRNTFFLSLQIIIDMSKNWDRMNISFKNIKTQNKNCFYLPQ